MFSFRGKEEPPLQIYGKLPIAKDYLRVGGGSDAARRFRDWLDRGFGGTVGEEAATELPYPMRFLWADRDGTVMQGLLRPSSDAGGLRRFPFALFVERRLRQLAKERDLAGAGDEAWWRALEGCEDEALGLREATELLASLRMRKVSPNSDGTSAPPTVSFDAWVAALWPDAGRGGCEHLVADVASLSCAGPLRLPLAWGLDLAAQVSAWTGILDELGWNTRSRNTLFYPAPQQSSETARAFLAVFGASPDPSESRWLCSTATSGPGDLVHCGIPGVATASGMVGTPLHVGLREALSGLRTRRGG